MESDIWEAEGTGQRRTRGVLRYEDVKRQTERHQDRKQKDERERESCSGGGGPSEERERV